MGDDVVELPRTLELVEPADVAELTAATPETARDVLEALHAIERAERPWRDPEVLRELYYDDGLDQAAIADRLGCGQKTVSRQMRRHGIGPGRGATAMGAKTLVAMDPDDILPRADGQAARDGRSAVTRGDGGDDGRG